MTITQTGGWQGATSTKYYNISTGSPPILGNFTISPLRAGKAFETLFAVTVEDWLPGEAIQAVAYWEASGAPEENGFFRRRLRNL